MSPVASSVVVFREYGRPQDVLREERMEIADRSHPDGSASRWLRSG